MALLFFGVRALYRQYLSHVPRQAANAGLVCKVRSYASESPKGSPNVEAAPAEETLLSGAALKLTAPPKASVDDTVVVTLCVEPAPQLPTARRKALLEHLLVQLSAVGLLIDPPRLMPASAGSGPCLGTASWTVRATNPGHYTAMLVPESVDEQSRGRTALASSVHWDFALAQPAQVNIQFQPEWTEYVQKFWGVLSTMLGTILVFTQVMMNLRRRKRSEAT